MTNFEKYKDELIGFIGRDSLAVVNGKPYRCSAVKCDDCEFNAEEECEVLRYKWATAEAEPTMTAEEAWELMKKIYLNPIDGCFSAKENFEIFGTTVFSEIITENTPQEAKAKIEAWKKANEKIKVGDVVKSNHGKGVVTRKYESDLYVVWDDGSAALYYGEERHNDFKRTGEHIDIEAVLKQLEK